MSNAVVQFSLGANGSLLSTQATYENSELQNHSMLTGMDQPYSVHRLVLDAFDMDNLSSPRWLSLDTSLVEKLLPSSPVSPLPKFDSFFPEFSQANQAESQAQNIDKSLNVNCADQESYENEMNQISNTSKRNQTTNKLCQFSYSSQQNLLDNCFQLHATEQENKTEKHNQYSLIQNECPTNMSLNVQQFGTHNHDPDFLVYWGKEQGITAASYEGNHIEQQTLCNDSSLAVTTGSPTNLIPLFDFDFRNQACSVGSAGSGLQQTINKQGTSTVAPLQRVVFRNMIDAKGIFPNLRRSLSGVSSNRQRSRIPTKRSEEEADGLHGWKREWHISMDISLIHDLELKNKKQRVEADGEESASILKRSESEDPFLRPGLSAANAILNILYPQIFFLLNRFTKAEQGSERQLDANILLDLELQALADQQKLPAHIYSALSSTASTNSFPFSTDLLLIRHIHHKLLTQLQSMEARACNTIKDTIMRFHFLHSYSAEVCRLKTSSLKVLYAQRRSMLLKSFQDSILLQHSNETLSNSVQSTLKTERPWLCPLTRQDQEADFCSASATPSSHECEPSDASICYVMTSMNTTSLCCTQEEIFDSSTDISQRKRLPKEACTFSWTNIC